MEPAEEQPGESGGAGLYCLVKSTGKSPLRTCTHRLGRLGKHDLISKSHRMRRVHSAQPGCTTVSDGDVDGRPFDLVLEVGMDEPD